LKSTHDGAIIGTSCDNKEPHIDPCH